MVKDALQSFMKEERLIYLEEHPTKRRCLFPVRRKRVEKESCNTFLGIDEDGKKENFTL